MLRPVVDHRAGLTARSDAAAPIRSEEARMLIERIDGLATELGPQDAVATRSWPHLARCRDHPC